MTLAGFRMIHNLLIYPSKRLPRTAISPPLTRYSQINLETAGPAALPQSIKMHLYIAQGARQLVPAPEQSWGNLAALPAQQQRARTLSQRHEQFRGGTHWADRSMEARGTWCRRRQQQHVARSLQVEVPTEAVPPEQAWRLLQEFSAKEARGLAQAFLSSREKRQQLRDALLVSLPPARRSQRPSVPALRCRAVPPAIADAAPPFNITQVAAGSPHTPAGWNPDAVEVPEVLLGIVASDVRLAVRSLRDYCQALGLPFKASKAAGVDPVGPQVLSALFVKRPTPHPPQMPESRVPGVAAAPAIAGPVYVKFNSATGLCYASTYEGRDRGVLVQLGQQQLGHLPLGLFDEAMARPPPPAL